MIERIKYLVKQFLDRNELASLAELRVQGCKDALELLEAGTVIAINNYYLRGIGLPYPYDDTQLCEITKNAKCEACAIGTLFVSMVNKHNDLTAKDYGRAKDISSRNAHTKYLNRFLPKNAYS